jgi:hypothetical protein
MFPSGLSDLADLADLAFAALRPALLRGVPEREREDMVFLSFFL